MIMFLNIKKFRFKIQSKSKNFLIIFNHIVFFLRNEYLKKNKKLNLKSILFLILKNFIINFLKLIFFYLILFFKLIYLFLFYFCLKKITFKFILNYFLCILIFIIKELKLLILILINFFIVNIYSNSKFKLYFVLIFYSFFFIDFLFLNLIRISYTLYYFSIMFDFFPKKNQFIKLSFFFKCFRNLSFFLRNMHYILKKFFFSYWLRFYFFKNLIGIFWIFFFIPLQFFLLIYCVISIIFLILKNIIGKIFFIFFISPFIIYSFLFEFILFINYIFFKLFIFIYNFSFYYLIYFIFNFFILKFQVLLKNFLNYWFIVFKFHIICFIVNYFNIFKYIFILVDFFINYFILLFSKLLNQVFKNYYLNYIKYLYFSGFPVTNNLKLIYLKFFFIIFIFFYFFFFKNLFLVNFIFSKFYFVIQFCYYLINITNNSYFSHYILCKIIIFFLSYFYIFLFFLFFYCIWKFYINYIFDEYKWLVNIFINSWFKFLMFIILFSLIKGFLFHLNTFYTFPVVRYDGFMLYFDDHIRFIFSFFFNLNSNYLKIDFTNYLTQNFINYQQSANAFIYSDLYYEDALSTYLLTGYKLEAMDSITKNYFCLYPYSSLNDCSFLSTLTNEHILLYDEKVLPDFLKKDPIEFISFYTDYIYDNPCKQNISNFNAYIKLNLHIKEYFNSLCTHTYTGSCERTFKIFDTYKSFLKFRKEPFYYDFLDTTFEYPTFFEKLEEYLDADFKRGILDSLSIKRTKAYAVECSFSCDMHDFAFMAAGYEELFYFGSNLEKYLIIFEAGTYIQDNYHITKFNDAFDDINALHAERNEKEFEVDLTIDSEIIGEESVLLTDYELIDRSVLFYLRYINMKLEDFIYPEPAYTDPVYGTMYEYSLNPPFRFYNMLEGALGVKYEKYTLIDKDVNYLLKYNTTSKKYSFLELSCQNEYFFKFKENPDKFINNINFFYTLKGFDNKTMLKCSNIFKV